MRDGAELPRLHSHCDGITNIVGAHFSNDVISDECCCDGGRGGNGGVDAWEVEDVGIVVDDVPSVLDQLAFHCKEFVL